MELTQIYIYPNLTGNYFQIHHIHSDLSIKIALDGQKGWK